MVIRCSGNHIFDSDFTFYCTSFHSVCVSYNDLSCCTEQGNTEHRRKQLHRHSVFACIEVFQDMQVTQTATLIEPDSRSRVSAKWLSLKMYCISSLGELKSIISCPCCWQAAGSSSSVCRLVGCLFLSFAEPSGSGKTDQLCAARGRGGTFFFPSANPQLLSLYQ